MLRFVIPILLIYVFFVVNLQAQFNLDLSAGFNLGYSPLMNVDNIGTSNSKSNANIYGSIIPSYKLNDRLTVSTALEYSEVGTYYKVSNSFMRDFEFYGEARYLRFIPIMEYYFLRNLSLDLGPNFGLLIDSESIVYHNPNVGFARVFYDQLISNLDMGGTVGVKYHVDIFHFHLSYYQGIINISDATFTDMSGNIISNASQRNHYIQLGLGIRLISNSKK